MHIIKGKNANFEIRTIEEGIFRVRMSSDEKFGETLLSRYNLLQENGEINSDITENDSKATIKAEGFTVTVDKKKETINFKGGNANFTVNMSGYEDKPYQNKGFDIGISLDDKERIFGIGDESRESIARRGTVARMDIKNIISYGPVPYLMSSNGWGFLLNCTYPHIFDIGSTDKNRVVAKCQKGVIDFYIFISKTGTLPEVLELQSRVTGKPLVMPKFVYGFTFVLNEQTNAREMLWDCKMFRKEDIPCDMVGLEPQWMTNHYDRSVDKKWDEERFYMPGWLPENQSGVFTFFYNLRELGFKLSLWLCNDYDLLWEEERQAGARAEKENVEYSFEGASIFDPHFATPNYMDNLTRREQPWFEHLKKFVDNGASAFKLDGAFQVNDHPDRMWASKYFDDEVHNVYPVIYAKQMQEGFKDHTDGRRAFIYTPCVYAGTQKYAASWAGDTGGGFDTVVAMLNFGLSGHTNVTCDMDPTDPKSLHYGFFTPWVQQLGWRNWHQPWFLREELEEMIRFYSKLRSSLFPYIYSMAHKAAKTALPMTRALSLMYPENPEYDYVNNMYMFGDSLLVGVFDMNITLPEGKWIDFWTDKVYEGGKKIKYKIPEGRGGALFVKQGSVFTTMEPQPYIEKVIPENYFINIYHGADCCFDLIEDDGYTYDYMEDKVAKTSIILENSKKDSFDLIVKAISGEFEGRAKRKGAAYKESDPEIKGMGKICSFDVILHTAEVEKITLNGKEVDFENTNGKCTFKIPEKLHESGDLKYSIKTK